MGDQVMASLSHYPQACPETGRRPRESGRRIRLSPFKLAGLAMIAFAVAGCVPRSRPAPPPPPPRPEPVAPPSRLPPDETRNRVAVLVPMSGSNAAVGQSILNAANLALFDTGGPAHPDHRIRHQRRAAAAANEALTDGNGLILGRSWPRMCARWRRWHGARRCR
jgi:hypothetical protein